MGLLLLAMILGIVWVTHIPLVAEDIRHVQGMVALATLVAVARAPVGGGRWLRLLLGLTLGAAAAAWEDWQAAYPEMPWPDYKGSKAFSAVVVDRNDRDDSVQLILEDFTWSVDQTAVPGQVQLGVYQAKVAVNPGDRIAGQARLKPLTDYRVPGVFPFADGQLRQGIKASGYTQESPQRIEGTPDWAINRLRQRISVWVGENIPARQQGLVEGILVGKRGRIAPTTNENMRTAGLIHLVAISGSNLGLVAGWAFFLFRQLLVMIFPLSRRMDVKRFAAVAALVFMLGYASLAGWSVATQRAAIMITVYLFAIMVGRGNQVWRSLGLAAILILLFQPNQLFQAGFQLSFLAVATLLVVGRMGWKPGWRHQLFSALTTTLVIGAVLTPITAYNFHQGSPYSILANIPAIPWVNLISVPVGMIGLILLPFFPTLGKPVLLLMGHTVELFDWWAAWVSALPGAWMRYPGPTLPGYTLMILAGTGWLVWKRFWPRASCLALAVCGWLWPHHAPPGDALQLTVLDMGQGQSALLHAPGDGWSIMDAGGAATPRFNVGESVISAHLWYRGVRRLQRIVLSHPDLDHVSGAAQLIRNFPVAELWLGYFPKEEEVRPYYRQIIEEAHRQGTIIRRFQTGVTMYFGGTTFNLLPPYLAGRRDNDRSLVFEVDYDTQRFLFPGDLEKVGERWLVQSGLLQPVTMILVPHHGSAGSSTPEFVRSVRPGHAVFSVGRMNRYRFPRASSLANWRESGARIWRTDRDGTLIFRTDGHRLEYEPIHWSHGGGPAFSVPHLEGEESEGGGRMEND
ncbi:MAG: DNA internalization-related competence protein ComEC/Rec2 [Magnetococcales bacterium]|nr:DNA internalization-related competence protein ComEC/Rec2 [Magnetococcales bacterium]